MKTTNTFRLALMAAVCVLASLNAHANSVSPKGAADTLKYNRSNTCQITIKHRGGMDFGNTFISNEPRTVYFTAYPTLGNFTGELCIGMFDIATNRIVASSEPRTVNIKVWDGFYLPFKANVPAGKYYLRLLARTESDEWSVCKITDYKAWYGADPATTEYYEGPELYEYNVIPFENKQPSLDYIRYYDPSEVFYYNIGQKYQMPYRMFNRLNEPLKGAIRLVYERNEIDELGSWFDVIGETEITIAPNSWKIDSLTMSATVDRGEAARYAATIRMYWREQNSTEWVLLTNIYNHGKEPQYGYDLNIGGIWTNLNHVLTIFKAASTAIEESPMIKTNIWYSSGVLYHSGEGVARIDLIDLTGQIAITLQQPQKSSPITLPNGIYIAKIVAESGMVSSHKIVVKN